MSLVQTSLAGNEQAQFVLNIGLIGIGAIGRAMIESLDANAGFCKINVVAVLVRRAVNQPLLPAAVSRAVVTDDFDEFMKTCPELVVECAGHEAVRDICPRVLDRATAVTLISAGALADRAIESTLRAAAEGAHVTITLPAGAVGGLDLLAAAKLAGLTRVRYIARKPPSAWLQTGAEQILDLNSLAKPQTFFGGTAREAALQFPQNANVAALIALAGIGFDNTEVSLIADPQALSNQHAVIADGHFGHAEIRIAGIPLPGNAKSSWLAALSLARSLLNISARLAI